jgi:hypothetical protein
MQTGPLSAFMRGQPAQDHAASIEKLQGCGWRVVLTDVDSLQAGPAALADAAEVPDRQAVAVMKLHANKTRSATGAVTLDTLSAALIEEVRARHARDLALLDAIAAAGGAPTDPGDVRSRRLKPGLSGLPSSTTARPPMRPAQRPSG